MAPNICMLPRDEQPGCYFIKLQDGPDGRKIYLSTYVTVASRWKRSKCKLASHTIDTTYFVRPSQSQIVSMDVQATRLFLRTKYRRSQPYLY